MTKNSDRSDRTKAANPMVRADESGHAKMYNMDMTYDAETLKVNFGMRLAELRLRRNVSAREMSISLGRGAGYINSIEGGHVLPSMVMLFEICDYLGVSPKEFFEFTEPEIKNYDESDATQLLEYASLMAKYSDFAEKAEAWDEEEMTDEELVYYVKVMKRVNEKLLEAGVAE